jgi:hypothetical protein
MICGIRDLERLDFVIHGAVIGSAASLSGEEVVNGSESPYHTNAHAGKDRPFT